MRFLIDECLTIDLGSIAHLAGHEAQHVARVGKAGWADWNVVRRAAEGDFVVVTNNATDFRRLYATQSLHAGLVIIIPNVDRERQRQLFRGALEALAQIGEPVNRVLEVESRTTKRRSATTSGQRPTPEPVHGRSGEPSSSRDGAEVRPQFRMQS